MFRRSLLALILVFSVVASCLAEEANRLRILIVADTLSDEGAFERRIKNEALIRVALVQELRKAKLQGRFTVDLLEDEKATPRKILDYYAKLQTEPREALCFYYNGHGSWHKTQGQVLAMKAGRLTRARLQKAMLACKPRLAVLMTDCCSNWVGKDGNGPPPESFVQPTQGKKPMAGSGSALRDLFFRHEGLVVISAASPGKLARGNPKNGNHFTQAFAELLAKRSTHFDRNGDGFVEWQEFFPHLRTQTERIARSHKSEQTPRAFALGVGSGF